VAILEWQSRVAVLMAVLTANLTADLTTDPMADLIVDLMVANGGPTTVPMAVPMAVPTADSMADQCSAVNNMAISNSNQPCHPLLNELRASGGNKEGENDFIVILYQGIG